MKRIFLALMLVASAASVNAHAYGVKVYQPLLVGPLAGAVYSEFMQKLTESGAVPCEHDMSSRCINIVFMAASGKRGRNRYVVGTATYMHIDISTGRLMFTEYRVFRNSASLKRSGKASFSASEFGIDRLELPTEHMDLRN